MCHSGTVSSILWLHPFLGLWSPLHSAANGEKGEMMTGAVFLWSRLGSSAHTLCIYHWLEFSHMTTSTCMGSWEMQSNYVPTKKRK